jgi:hypothetical protein
MSMVGTFLIDAPIGMIFYCYFVLKHPLLVERSWRDYTNALASVVITKATAVSFPFFMDLRVPYNAATGMD